MASRFYLSTICILFVLHASYYYNYTSDDAFIIFRYSENWADGHGFVYNTGEKVEGYSNFLWVLLIGLIMRGGLDPIVSVKVVGIVSTLGTFFILTKFSKFFPKKIKTSFY